MVDGANICNSSNRKVGRITDPAVSGTPCDASDTVLQNFDSGNGNVPETRCLARTGVR